MSLDALSSDALCELRKTVEDVFVEALKLLRVDQKHRIGAYFCSADQRGRPLALFAVGIIPDDKVERYMKLACEKAKRLSNQPTYVTSSQSRNPDRDEWGGAIRVMSGRVQFGEFFALSGLTPDLLDEAVCLVVALRLGVLWPEMVDAAAVHADNDFVSPLMDICFPKK